MRQMISNLLGYLPCRNPDSVNTVSGVPVYSMDQAENFKDDIDVMVLCGGSATDLPEQTPALASMFNVVDSFDTHANIPEHFKNVDEAAKAANKTAAISIGWDQVCFH